MCVEGEEEKKTYAAASWRRYSNSAPSTRTPSGAMGVATVKVVMATSANDKNVVERILMDGQDFEEVLEMKLKELKES